MSVNKKRYSIPARVIELLYTDDSFFNEVMKIKKANSGSKFPRSDEWRDQKGFNISFALAGYSPSDIQIGLEADNVLVIRGKGLDSINVSSTDSLNKDDAFDEYSKTGRPRIHIGSISRGIARRKFCVKHLISEEFDVCFSSATMENGLLHIFIPESKAPKHQIIEIE